MSGAPLELIRRSHEILAKLGIGHALIGGWAVIAWGRVRATRDIDWLAEIPPSKRKDLLAALTPLGAPEWRPPGEDDPIAGLIRVSPKASDGYFIDILFARSPADRRAVAKAVAVDIGGGEIPSVPPEEIIAMKLQAGGGLDLDDAKELLRVHAGKLDAGELEEACRSRRSLDALHRLRAT